MIEEMLGIDIWQQVWNWKVGMGKPIYELVRKLFSDRVNSYLGLQGTVNEDEIALNFGTWDSTVVVYDLFEVASSFSFQSSRRQWYQFRLRRLILHSFSLLTDSCIQNYAPSRNVFSNGTK